MRKIIGLLIFGTILGITSAFCAGSMEAARLAEGVNFDNQSEVIAYATALRSNEAVIAQAQQEGVSVDIWIRNVVVQMTEEYHFTQKAEAERQAELRIFANADAWASRNLGAGIILIDTNTRKQLKEEFEKNKAR